MVEDASHVLLDDFVNIFSVVVVNTSLVLVTFLQVIDFELTNEHVKITVALPGVGKDDGAFRFDDVIVEMLTNG